MQKKNWPVWNTATYLNVFKNNLNHAYQLHQLLGVFYHVQLGYFFL